MRCAWLVALTCSLTLLWCPISQAQCPGVTTQLQPFATEVLTVSTTALGLTPAVYQPVGTVPSMAMMTVEGGDLRYEVIGTPTADLGHPVLGQTPQTFPICGSASIQSWRGIRMTTDAKVTVTYYKPKTP